MQLGDAPVVARRRPSRRSAGRARRAGCAARPSSRSRRRACASRPPRTRAGRRGTWGRCGPCETSPTPWPARPMRCRPRVTDFGDSTWSTRSTAPMSMPSSSERRGDQARAARPDLSSSSTIEPLLARERAVVGAGDLAARRPSPSVCRVGRARSAASPAARPAAAVVDEHDRRAVRADQLQQLGVDRRPDRAARGGRRRRRRRPRRASRRRRRARACPRPGPSISQVERLAQAGVDDRALAARRRPGSGRPPRAGAGSPTGRSAARGRSASALEPLERERQVRAALGLRRRRGSRRRSPHSTPAKISRAREVSIR